MTDYDRMIAMLSKAGVEYEEDYGSTLKWITLRADDGTSPSLDLDFTPEGEFIEYN